MTNAGKHTDWKQVVNETTMKEPLGCNFKPRINRPPSLNGIDMTPFSYFGLLWPKEILDLILKHTNNNLKEKKYGELDKAELTRYLGIRLYMAVYPIRGSVEDYWRQKSSKESLEPFHDVGTRCQMSRHRFQNITSCLAVGSGEDVGNEQVTTLASVGATTIAFTVNCD